MGHARQWVGETSTVFLVKALTQPLLPWKSYACTSVSHRNSSPNPLAEKMSFHIRAFRHNPVAPV